MRQNLQFEDKSFTNSKKYFWALQSLRLFDDHISGTLRELNGILHCTLGLDRSFKGYREYLESEEEMQRKKFEELKMRIERKRRELESLNDSVST